MKLFCLLVAFATLTVSLKTVASEAEDLIKYRQGLMNSSSISVNALFNYSRNKLPLSMESVQQHADIIYQNAKLLNKDLEMIFPEGSTADVKTDAKKEIWMHWQDFAEKSDSYVRAAETFKELINNNPSKQDVMNGFRDMRKACGSCHRNYKADD
jgi:cytochrome c556